MSLVKAFIVEGGTKEQRSSIASALFKTDSYHMYHTQEGPDGQLAVAFTNAHGPIETFDELQSAIQEQGGQVVELNDIPAYAWRSGLQGIVQRAINKTSFATIRLPEQKHV